MRLHVLNVRPNVFCILGGLGAIPPEIGDLKQLRYLYLGDNGLQGGTSVEYWLSVGCSRNDT